MTCPHGDGDAVTADAQQKQATQGTAGSNGRSGENATGGTALKSRTTAKHGTSTTTSGSSSASDDSVTSCASVAVCLPAPVDPFLPGLAAQTGPAGTPAPVTVRAPTPGAPATAPRVVTAEEVARFLPAQGAVHSEPNGWAVVGLPDNFWVEVTVGVVDGQLFGDDVQVRFTPQGYVWNYGDGATRSSTTPGASWRSLGQRQLTDTATSHVYDERGRHTVTAQIVYSAEYEIAGGPWLPVTGAVRATTPGTRILAAVESTVLTPNP